jgi:hypothetical protein
MYVNANMTPVETGPGIRGMGQRMKERNRRGESK